MHIQLMGQQSCGESLLQTHHHLKQEKDVYNAEMKKKQIGGNHT
jgi:hypothetical protein